MSIRVCTLGFAAMMWALPAAAQERGTMEFGAFGSAAKFDDKLTLKTGYGGGGRIGMYLDRGLAVEFEDAEMRASRPGGLKDVNVGILSGRLVATPFTAGALSLIVGAGAGVSTETNFLHTYGVDALVGAKLALSDNVSLRVDGVWDWLANQDWQQYRSVRAGLSVYRRPAQRERIVTRTIEVAAPAPVMMMHEDSVSAAETRRLRDRDAALRALRDSLDRARRTPPPEVVKIMEAHIHFAFNKSVLTDSARALLDQKVAVFKANPELSIMMVGYTDRVGKDAYNMALGERRAKAARNYLVARGIAPERVILESKGERDQIPGTAGKAGEAENRRAIFRLIMAQDDPRKP
ncbi:MAG: OmpA family protein [Polaromonas sp.]|nr:OmpA family protein [Gemmatimonadaceae bacterium]